MKSSNTINPIVKWFILLTFLSILFILLCTTIGIDLLGRINTKLNTIEIHTEQIYQNYDDLVYENEVLWKFIENLDTYKDLDDAVYDRDYHLPDWIQFIDE